MEIFAIIVIMMMAYLSGFVCALSFVFVRDLKSISARHFIRTLAFISMLLCSLLFGAYYLWFLLTALFTFVSVIFTLALVNAASIEERG